MKPNAFSRSVLLSLGALVALSNQHAHAADATWTGTTDGAWATGTNWSTTPVPGTGDTATFNSGSVNTAVTPGTITLNSILFDTSSAAAYTLGTGTITLNGGGGITMNSSVANNQIINTQLRLGESNGDQSFAFTNNSTTNSLSFGSAATINSSTAGTKTLTVGGAGGTTISGVISNGSGTVALNKTGTGTLTYGNQAATYTGATTITGGRILLNGSGRITGTSGFSVTNGILEVSYSSASLTAKLATAPMTLRGSSYLQTGRNATSSSTAESIGALTLDTGANIITLTQATNTSTTTTLTASSLVRNNNATAFVRGSNALGTQAAATNGATFLAITSSPTADLIGGSGTYASGTATDIKIVPYFVGDSGASGSALPTFLGYDTANNSFRTLKSGEYLTSFGGATATSNIRLSGTGTAVAITAGTYNSMILNEASATGTVTYTLGGTLTLNSGALLVSKSTGTAQQAIITGGLLQFAASNVAGTSRQEGIISNFIGNDLRIDSQISGSGGLTLSTFTNGTASTITLNSTSNNYTGTTTVNGTVKLGQANVVPNGSGVYVGHGGVFDLNGNSEGIDALTGAGTVDTTAATNLATLTVGSNSGSGTFSGIIRNTGASGAALAVVKAGAGTQTFTGANTYTGGTTLNQGTLTVGTGGTLGASTRPLSVNNTNSGAGTSAVLNLSTEVNTAVGTLSGSIATPTSGTNTATINTQTGRNFSVTQTANATYAGAIAGGGSFTLAAGSTHALTLTGSNTYTGATTVSAGLLIVNGNISTSLVNVAAAGTLGGSGTVGGNTIISGTHSPGNSPGIITHGGNLTYEANSNVIWELVANSTASRGTNFDGINVGATLDFNGATTLNLNFQFGASAVEWSDTFWASSYTGTSGWLVYSGATSLDGFAFLGLNAPTAWLDENGDTLASARPDGSFNLFQDGNNIYLNYAVVPEPASASLLGLALGAAALRRRRSIA